MMKFFLRAAAASLCFFWGATVLSAQQSISGTVTDVNGDPLVGVGIFVEGTTTGTVTDSKGTYSLSVPAGTNLTVSSIGYKTENIVVVAERNVYNLILSEDTSLLDDVVVIGYQTVRRRDLTGAVASITGKDIATVPVANAAQALQGKLAGVQVVTSSGAPGASISIRVRGGNSITQSNEPLILVDGIVSSLSNVPADQIESIDVLKDAASTAIYGARGANGVIIVTTKGAKEGKVAVHYNMYYQYKETPRMLDVMNAEDFMLWQWSYATAYGESYGDGVAQYYGLGSKYGNHFFDYRNVTAHNHMNDVLKASNSWNHDISLSGGNGSTNYLISVSYMQDDGTRLKSGLDRWSVNGKLVQKLSDAFKVDFDVRYSDFSVHGGSRNASAYGYRPIDNPLGDGMGYHLGQGDSNVELEYDPVSIINNTDSFSSNYNLLANSGLTWSGLEGLTARTELTLGRTWGNSKDYNGGGGIGGASYKTATISNRMGTNLRWTNTLNYSFQKLGDNHALNMLLGHEYLDSKSETGEMHGEGYPDDFDMMQTFGMFSMTNRELKRDTYDYSFGTPSRTLSFFGRVNYTLLNRYLLTLTFRADGSSKFAPNHRWGYFPAAALAWRISDEPFMANAKSWVDMLKLRVSYGTSGSDSISSSLWKETWSTTTVKVDGVDVPVYRPASMLQNTDLKWETTISRNVGLDYGFFKNRFHGSLELYHNTTKDILMQIPIDASTGYSYQYQNAGRTSNKGIELSFLAELIKKRDFQLAMNLNYSYNRNNIDHINSDANADVHTGWGSSMQVPQWDYIIREGNPVGIVQGYVSEGIYTVDDFNYVDGKYVLKDGIPDFSGSGVVNYPNGVKELVPAGQTAFPGAAKFKDVDGNGVIDADDYDIIGNLLPRHSGGFGLMANWKNFDLSAHFTFQLDGQIYNANAMHSMMGNKDTSFGDNRLAYVSDCWKSYNVDKDGSLYLITDPAELAAFNAKAKYAVPYSEYGITTSEFIEDAAFLRLNTLTLGYSLSHTLLEKIRVSACRLYLTGANLFCLSSYSGLDPDVNTRSSTVTPYYDYQAYPKPRTLTCGLTVTF